MSEAQRLALARLYEAAREGDAAAARAALADGADPNQKLYGEWECPLLINTLISSVSDRGVGCGNFAMARLLLEGGADPNALEGLEGRSAHSRARRSALRLMCESGREEAIAAVRLLCEFGADPDLGDPRWPYAEPLAYALMKGRGLAAREMILAGYDPRSPMRLAGVSALELAREEGLFEMAETMLGAWAERERLELSRSTPAAEPKPLSRSRV